MRTIEIKPVQLGLGEKVIIEKKRVEGVIGQNEFVVVPSEKGFCNARLAQKEAEIKRVDNCKIRGLSGWRINEIIHVEKNINGNWERWPIPEGSVIGVFSKNVKRRSKTTIPIIRRNPTFSQKRFQSRKFLS